MVKLRFTVILLKRRINHINFWDPYRKYQVDCLEKIQRRAAPFATRTYRTNEGCVTRAFNHVQWPTLESLGKSPGFPSYTKPFTAKPRSTYHFMSPTTVTRRQVHFWHSTAFGHAQSVTGVNPPLMYSTQMITMLLKRNYCFTSVMSFQDFACLVCRCSPCRPFCWCLLRAAEFYHIEICH